MGAYPIGIVGESFGNDDGSSRQAEIARCRPGEGVTLEREPDNKYDRNCVRVISVRGIQIGNISRDDDWICERLDRGGFVDARILSVGKGAKGKFGVILCVRTVEDDEWLAENRQTPTFGRKPPKGCSVALLVIIIPALCFALTGFGGPP